MAITYKNIKCSKMSEREINDASRLFSENYGTWSPSCGDKKANKPVKLSAAQIRKKFVEKRDCMVALAYDNKEIIGQVFYVRRKGEKTNYVTWILQLVIKRSYRGQNIGSNLMRSIWQLSNSYAWGLYTSNPMTIKTLEEVTMRTVNEKLVKKHLNKLREVAIDFFPTMDWIDGFHDGFVNTTFLLITHIFQMTFRNHIQPETFR